VADAERLRVHLQHLLREAMAGRGSAEPGALDVVVVGGGPTGVETTGSLAELMQAVQSTGLWVPRTVTQPLISAFAASRPTSRSPSIAHAA
jgi:NADH dehydrogenase